MTEIDRILEKGVINQEFLNEVEQYGFLITNKRKKVFAVLLDMLVEFDAICKRHGLTYFMFGGSMLGAVRHHGFIPWDDDIDVIMPRKDFDAFYKLSYEFHDPLFLQTPYTDPDYFYSCIRIRNSNTTALVETFKYQNFNQGIWLSIFPLDNWVLEGGEERYERLRYLAKENSTYMRMKNPELSEENKRRVENYSGRNPLATYEEYHNLARKFLDTPTEFVAHLGFVMAPLNTHIYRAKDFSYSIPCQFENYIVQIPVGYDNILHDRYGDYMTPPTHDKRGVDHSGTIFDPDKPYTEYIPK